ncbi:MAG: GAF domain-containing protein [Deltaproteobacteria bacterium]|nr:GAF domain-containing protein [Deltaproteobacteria bacterium]
MFSVEAGDWTYAVYGAANVISNLIIAGVHCDEVKVEADKYLQFLKDKATVGLNSFFLPGGYCALLNLQGRTRAANSFDCEHLDEERFHETLGHLSIVEAWFYAVKIRSLYIHRCFEEGARVITKAEVVAEGVPGQVKVPEAYFYSCLMLAAAQNIIGDTADRARLWVLFRKYEAQMKQWADHCPDNYLHKYCLIVAERLRVEGGTLDDALGWYDRAIQSAEEGHFVNVAAVARELKGRYWLERKRGSYAKADLREAHYGYQLWGATRKVAMLEAEFEGLSLGSRGGTDYAPAELDLLSAHKASRAISGKIELEDLIQTMMSIVMESAGADRGLLLRDREGRWQIEADAVLAESNVRVITSADRDSRGHEAAPLSVVHYVVRTQAPVTVDDPARDPRFGHDPYILAVQPKSILCVPLLHQGRTAGVLYLENKLGRDVFTADRRALVDVLTGQMAISLENAGLYANVKATLAEQGRMMADLERQRAELVRKNDELAEQRAQLSAQAATLRSLNAEVLSSNSELEAFSYSVAHDLRAPLRGMNGFATVLLEEYKEKLDADGIDCLREIHSNAVRMGQLIDAMLALARVSRAELKPESVDLTSLARAVATELAATEPQRRLEVVIEDGIQGFIDKRLARAMLENLFGNAWKFTRDVAQPRVELGTLEDGGGVSCFVRDNGAGFDMAYADKLFGPFQRLHSAREFPGTGIGLATAKRILHRSGGRIWAEGRVGGGATFHFTVPQLKRSAS